MVSSNIYGEPLIPPYIDNDDDDDDEGYFSDENYFKRPLLTMVFLFT